MNPYAHHHACYRCDASGSVPLYVAADALLSMADADRFLRGAPVAPEGISTCPDCNGTGKIECSDRRCEEEPL